jgi:phage gp36-like protein
MYSNKEYFLTKIDLETLNTLTNSVDDNLNSAISSADSLINGYIGSAVKLPLTPVPDILKQVSYDIAVFHLHDRIQYKDIPERIRDKYDAALNYLKDVAAGKVIIDGVQAEQAEGQIQYGSDGCLFDRGVF